MACFEILYSWAIFSQISFFVLVDLLDLFIQLFFTMISSLNCQDCFGFHNWLPVFWCTPALLMSFGIKRNSSPRQCLGKISPDLLVLFKLSSAMVVWLEGLLDVFYCMLLRS